MIDHNIIQYAYNIKGERVSIFDVKTGLNTGCFCRLCGNTLGAKNKCKTKETVLKLNQKAAHFYHPPELNCKGETLLHIIAKEVFKKKKKLLFDIKIYNHRGQFVRNGQKLIEFDDVILEKNVDVETKKWIRPDAKGIKNENHIYVEFANTSFIDCEKEDLIKSKNLNVIEIELNVPYIDWNEYQDEKKLEEKITEFLFSKSISSSNWINNYNFKSLLTEVIDTTEQELAEKNERLAREDRIQLMEVKKEIIRSVLQLGSKRRVYDILSYESKTHYLNDDHFFIENNEVFIIESSYNELIELKQKCWQDWERVPTSSFDRFEFL